MQTTKFFAFLLISSTTVFQLASPAKPDRFPIQLTGAYDSDGDGIIGAAGKDYPNFAKIPVTSFDCKGLLPGFYSDVEAACQVYHVCQPGQRKTSFLCNNGTIFNQKVFTCDWWYQVACEESQEFYKLNELMYIEKPTKKPLSAFKGQFPSEALNRPLLRPNVAPKAQESETGKFLNKLLESKARYESAAVLKTTSTSTLAYEEEEEITATEAPQEESTLSQANRQEFEVVEEEEEEAEEIKVTTAPSTAKTNPILHVNHNQPMPMHPGYPNPHRHRYTLGMPASRSGHSMFPMPSATRLG